MSTYMIKTVGLLAGLQTTSAIGLGAESQIESQ